MLRIRQIHCSGWFSYLVYEEGSRQAAIVDPVLCAADLLELVAEDLELDVRYLVESRSPYERASGLRGLVADLDASVICAADASHPLCGEPVSDGRSLRLGQSELEIRAAPGITHDGLVVVTEHALLTGDVLHVGSTGPLGLPGHDADALFGTLRRVVDPLPDNTLIYPYRDTHAALFSTLGAERASNAELNIRDRGAFVQHKQAQPRVQTDARMRANFDGSREAEHDLETLALGCATQQASRPTVPPHGQVSHIGVHEAGARLADDHPLIDVREQFEVDLAEVPGSRHLPMSALGDRLAELSEDAEHMVLCAHGNRSLLAAHTLQRLGFRVASVTGGLAQWREAGLKVA